jgi:hypothetical protein
VPLGESRFRVTGPFFLEKGTGRFEGATGTGEYDAVIDLGTLRTEGTFKATVTTRKK